MKVKFLAIEKFQPYIQYLTFINDDNIIVLYNSYPHSIHACMTYMYMYVQLEGPLRNLWFPTPDRAMGYETSFIVVGPIPNDNPGHLTTGLDNNICS